MKQKLYLLIDLDDKYELPLAVCGTEQELAAVAGTTLKTVRSSLSLVRCGKIKRSRYVEVEV